MVPDKSIKLKLVSIRAKVGGCEEGAWGTCVLGASLTGAPLGVWMDNFSLKGKQLCPFAPVV